LKLFFPELARAFGARQVLLSRLVRTVHFGEQQHHLTAMSSLICVESQLGVMAFPFDKHLSLVHWKIFANQEKGKVCSFVLFIVKNETVHALSRCDWGSLSSPERVVSCNFDTATSFGIPNFW